MHFSLVRAFAQTLNNASVVRQHAFCWRGRVDEADVDFSKESVDAAEGLQVLPAASDLMVQELIGEQASPSDDRRPRSVDRVHS
jgi:hypothetical protein